MGSLHMGREQMLQCLGPVQGAVICNKYNHTETWKTKAEIVIWHSKSSFQLHSDFYMYIPQQMEPNYMKNLTMNDITPNII